MKIYFKIKTHNEPFVDMFSYIYKQRHFCFAELESELESSDVRPFSYAHYMCFVLVVAYLSMRTLPFPFHMSIN